VAQDSTAHDFVKTPFHLDHRTVPRNVFSRDRITPADSFTNHKELIMNANIAHAIRNAEAFLLGRQYNRPLHPQPAKTLSSKPVSVSVASVPKPALLTRKSS
jgi:hypothetical protein